MRRTLEIEAPPEKLLKGIDSAQRARPAVNKINVRHIEIGG